MQIIGLKFRGVPCCIGGMRHSSSCNVQMAFDRYGQSVISEKILAKIPGSDLGSPVNKPFVQSAWRLWGAFSNLYGSSIHKGYLSLLTPTLDVNTREISFVRNPTGALEASYFDRYKSLVSKIFDEYILSQTYDVQNFIKSKTIQESVSGLIFTLANDTKDDEVILSSMRSNLDLAKNLGVFAPQRGVDVTKEDALRDVQCLASYTGTEELAKTKSFSASCLLFLARDPKDSIREVPLDVAAQDVCRRDPDGNVVGTNVAFMFDDTRFNVAQCRLLRDMQDPNIGNQILDGSNPRQFLGTPQFIAANYSIRHRAMTLYPFARLLQAWHSSAANGDIRMRQYFTYRMGELAALILDLQGHK